MEKEVPNRKTINTKDYISENIVPLKVPDILNYEVRIAECYARNDIRDVRIRNDYFSIAKIIQLISDGYFICPSDEMEELEPFFQQMILIDYYCGNDPNFKQRLADENILPTFIIEYEGPGITCSEGEKNAILGYCFTAPMKNPMHEEIMCKKICEKIYNSKINYPEDYEITDYNSYDYGDITGISISNNLYVPVFGEIAYVR